MNYPNLFSKYQPLKGKAWIKSLPQDEVDVFVRIGLQETDYGQKGGRALYMQRGREYMSRMGRIGAIATNSWKLWKRLMQEEMEKELGVTFDF